MGPDARDAVPALIDALRDKKAIPFRADRRTHVGPASGLHGIGQDRQGSRAAAPALREALKDADDTLRYYAAGALVMIGPVDKCTWTCSPRG